MGKVSSFPLKLESKYCWPFITTMILLKPFIWSFCVFLFVLKSVSWVLLGSSSILLSKKLYHAGSSTWQNINIVFTHLGRRWEQKGGNRPRSRKHYNTFIWSAKSYKDPSDLTDYEYTRKFRLWINKKVRDCPSQKTPEAFFRSFSYYFLFWQPLILWKEQASGCINNPNYPQPILYWCLYCSFLKYFIHCHLKQLDNNVCLTRLSSIRIRASNSCSPICHFGWDTEPSPAGDSGERDLALYFPGSNNTRLSGPPALARVRTLKTIQSTFSFLKRREGEKEIKLEKKIVNFKAK